VTISLPSAPPVVRPRVRSVPEYEFSSGPEAIELAAQAGLVLDSWQADAVTDVLGEDSSGKWAAFESGLLVPRQNGKGAILECLEIADLFLFGIGQPDFLVIHTAHEFKTAQEAFRRVLFLVENNDWLRKKVARVRTSHGEEGLELTTGQRLRFLARSGGSGRGFSCDRLIYDEAYELSEESVAASLPTMSARSNPHVTYTSSAALDKSRVLRSVMSRGRREDDREADPGLCYIEYSADPKTDLDNRDEWRRANPATESGRIKLEFVAKERAAMSDVTFGRERLGIVDESKNSTVIDMELVGCGWRCLVVAVRPGVLRDRHRP
jgi:phage terminase large subunit-like protein